jgi:hypothetical protein
VLLSTVPPNKPLQRTVGRRRPPAAERQGVRPTLNIDSQRWQIVDKGKEQQIFKDFCEETTVVRYDDFELNSEAPDFISKDRALGIELVSYHRDAPVAGGRGSPLRVWESQLERLVGEARDHHRGHCQTRANVYVFPERGSRKGTLTIPPQAAAEIARLVALRLAGQRVGISALLRPIIEEMNVSATPDYQEECEWEVAIADWIDVDVKAVQAVLDGKEGLVTDYRKRASQVWLLVHGSRMPYVGAKPDDGRWSTCGHITTELATTQFRSSFDRAYYFDLEQRKHVRLCAGAV